jgi:Co/Zn/Cd efflux system component
MRYPLMEAHNDPTVGLPHSHVFLGAGHANGILLDVCPDELTREKLRRTLEVDGDRVVDLHLWRLGPGHLGAVLAIATSKPRDALFYRSRLSSFECLSHITVEVNRGSAA